MSKKDKCYIEIQKGPISMEDQFHGKFRREPEMTREDIKHMSLRQSGKTLTKHEPKR